MKAREGQVMLLTVLTLGGTLLGATTIAGLLMVYQVRQGTDLSQSAKAIFAADAGIEWGLYNVLCDAAGTSTAKPCPVSANPPTLANGAALAVTCRTESGATVPDCKSSTTISIKSKGTYGNVSRAFCIFESCDATSSAP